MKHMYLIVALLFAAHIPDPSLRLGVAWALIGGTVAAKLWALRH